MNLILLVVAGYLVGSLSFAVIVSRAMGLPDPHSYGSGNPGATNVLRTGKKLAAVLTLAGDALKGLAVVLVARSLAAKAGFGPGDIALGGLAAFLGHLYPVFFGFRGGKGVATAAGVLFGLSATLGGIVLAVWIAVFAISRVSSLGALAAAIAAPIAAAFLIGNDRVVGAVVVMAGLLIWRHRDNIRRLRAGAEKRIGAK
jgi:acyl phosphate:glycerol-3-phosphate acyltransferase